MANSRMCFFFFFFFLPFFLAFVSADWSLLISISSFGSLNGVEFELGFTVLFFDFMSHGLWLLGIQTCYSTLLMMMVVEEVYSPVRLVAAGFSSGGSVSCSFRRRCRCRILYHDRSFYRRQPQHAASDAASDATSYVNETNKSWCKMLTLLLPPVPAACITVAWLAEWYWIWAWIHFIVLWFRELGFVKVEDTNMP